jgi:NAD(P)-dependent dehydrogenase (short-subunit alcohol dehydrogenase family)
VDLGLTGKSCIVTGAGRGIGAATARMLEDEGAGVVRVSRNSDDLACDVTDPDAAERIVGACIERFGRVDVLVNNAGTSRARSLDELTDADWAEQWELNVMAPMRLMQAVAPRMAEAGEGRIVNVTSSSGKRPSPRNAAYSVTKAAQLSLSRVYADRWAGSGVLVNAVMPGPVATPLWVADGGLADQTAEREGITRDQALEQAAAKIPLGRMGTEDEVAAVVVFLCSARASNVTGAAWAADGGAVPLMF